LFLFFAKWSTESITGECLKIKTATSFFTPTWRNMRSVVYKTCKQDRNEDLLLLSISSRNLACNISCIITHLEGWLFVAALTTPEPPWRTCLITRKLISMTRSAPPTLIDTNLGTSWYHLHITNTRFSRRLWFPCGWGRSREAAKWHLSSRSLLFCLQSAFYERHSTPEHHKPIPVHPFSFSVI
jgi:hypothetical protein